MLSINVSMTESLKCDLEFFECISKIICLKYACLWTRLRVRIIAYVNNTTLDARYHRSSHDEYSYTPSTDATATILRFQKVCKNVKKIDSRVYQLTQ